MRHNHLQEMQEKDFIDKFIEKNLNLSEKYVLELDNDELVPGHLDTKTLKKGEIYYLVIELKIQEPNGKIKRYRPWISTGLIKRGNTKKAKDLLILARKKFTLKLQEATQSKQEQSERGYLFADLLLDFLKDRERLKNKNDIMTTTFATDQCRITNVMNPYFRQQGYLINEVDEQVIENFYDYLRKERNSAERTILHYHVVLSQTFKYALKQRLLKVNPMIWVEPVVVPDSPDFDYLRKYEVRPTLQAFAGHRLEIFVYLACYYGMRRSEIIGLKWSKFDFEANRFLINHTVKETYKDGKTELIAEDRTKSPSSRRSMPLIKPIRDKLLELKKHQQECRKLCGKSYNNKYLEYVCVDDLGNLIKPGYVTGAFPKILVKNGLRRITPHNLRHSCASLLLAEGVPLKEISEFLGHNDVKTTEMYAHLEFKSKINSAQTMVEIVQSAMQMEEPLITV